ncbi:TraI domain-containing protein [Ralstonia solanacearum]|uniref:TraI domain-containing protein n=1 Tax=Ralstonia solanacearum TaxID=305 RepID=UPI0005C5BE91|nr:TraI domain-containing protein [Ralstonia solanacearum]MBB6592732.1 TraI domain-containing protein [Ralstonia solanacearum]MBB6596954.1 TraI domain-containing protein [Ralstonia solanacearum]MDB0541198.1 TraI domain-containing protein [Ralstonia solanacearum]MDB0551428.1 TraI domain-containing protein [Ralstonia solanacearum]MDB0556147.1 TraI domain-containing protein [Ralstonia solanacearum]
MNHTPMPVSTLTTTLGSRLELVRQYANESSNANFERKWLSVLDACADWYSSMPLRPEQHPEPGGAFRATVETVYYALRLSGGQKFGADQPSERRRKLEPQYLYAVFLAACSTWLDEPFRHFQFFRLTDQSEWSPAAHGAFSAWLQGAEYRVQRREAPLPVERMRTALLARSILGSTRLELLESVVQTDLFGAINPESRPAGTESLLHKVLRQAVAVTCDTEDKARRARFAPDTTPIPPVKSMEDAIAAQAQTTPAAEKRATAPKAKAAKSEPSAADDVSALFEQAKAAPAQSAEAPPAAAPEKPSGQSSLFDLNSMQAPKASSVQAPDPFADILSSAGNLIRDFFRVLMQDVESGKVAVHWAEKGLVLQKRVLGSYGIASETLVDNLRKLNLLASAQGADIVLVERIGSLILPRPQQ